MLSAHGWAFHGRALAAHAQGTTAMNNAEQQFLNDFVARLWDADDRQNLAGLGYAL
jgi:hypothetical protein